jgi:hypothetical protein
MHIEQLAPRVYCSLFPDWRHQNPIIEQEFHRCLSDPATRRSHYFNGRYENIYVAAECILALQPVLVFARECVQQISGNSGPFRLGFWFNDAGPGDQTLAHSHDNYDEILSAVYYVKIPAGAGQLVLEPDSGELVITPAEGKLVLFAPDIIHSVRANTGTGHRLSVAMNVGPETEAS